MRLFIHSFSYLKNNDMLIIFALNIVRCTPCEWTLFNFWSVYIYIVLSAQQILEEHWTTNLLSTDIYPKTNQDDTLKWQKKGWPHVKCMKINTKAGKMINKWHFSQRSTMPNLCRGTLCWVTVSYNKSSL